PQVERAVGAGVRAARIASENSGIDDFGPIVTAVGRAVDTHVQTVQVGIGSENAEGCGLMPSTHFRGAVEELPSVATVGALRKAIRVMRALAVVVIRDGHVLRVARLERNR